MPLCNLIYLDILDRSEWFLWRIATEAIADSTMRLITQLCDKTMPKKHKRQNRREEYWWTDEIASLRRACITWQRRSSRAKAWRIPNAAELARDRPPASANASVSRGRKSCSSSLPAVSNRLRGLLEVGYRVSYRRVFFRAEEAGVLGFPWCWSSTHTKTNTIQLHIYRQSRKLHHFATTIHTGRGCWWNSGTPFRGWTHWARGVGQLC